MKVMFSRNQFYSQTNSRISHITRLKVQIFLSSFELAGFLQEFVLLQPEGHAHGHLCDEPLAGRLRHLLAEPEVDLTDASAALEKA